VYTHTWSPGPYGTIVDTIACNTGNCNSTIVQNLYVQLSYTDVFGTQSVSISVAGASISSVPNIPATILGWNTVFSSIAPLQFVSYFFIIMAAAIFGVYSAKFGGIVVVGVMATLTYFGWFTLGVGTLMFSAVIAAVYFIAYLEAGR
jgi:hypothetical protein